MPSTCKAINSTWRWTLPINRSTALPIDICRPPLLWSVFVQYISRIHIFNLYISRICQVFSRGIYSSYSLDSLVLLSSFYISQVGTSIQIPTCRNDKTFRKYRLYWKWVHNDSIPLSTVNIFFSPTCLFFFWFIISWLCHIVSFFPKPPPPFLWPFSPWNSFFKQQTCLF